MVSASQKLGKYIFLEEQESTALGATWRAGELVDGKIERSLLAQEIAPGLAGDAGFRDYYLKHSAAAAKLEHPNILRKMNTIREGGIISFFEYQEGFSLERVMKRCQSEMNPFSVDHALLVVSKLLSALDYAKTRHITHGFVNPSMVFVTHEGEIKLRGFTLSSALRSAANTPGLGDYHRNYVPAGMSITAETHDRLDIYGCGAILYEMLVGAPFKGTDVAATVAAAETAMEGDPIPPKIAHIIVNSLDGNLPTSYRDIQKMAKDMDELLFSGEYSPTTFNLAFFMHSAFRQEMEELGEKIAAEKERDYNQQEAAAVAAPAPAAAPVPAATAPSEPVVSAPPPRNHAPSSGGSQSGGKSKMPMLVGGVVVVLLAIIAVIFLMPKKGSEDNSAIDSLGEQLISEGETQKKDQEKENQEELRRANEELQELLREQAEEEKRRKREELETEMAAVDKEIRETRQRKEEQERLKTLEAELEKYKKQLEAKNEEDALKKSSATAAASEKREPVKPKPKPTETASASKPATTTTEPAPTDTSSKPVVEADSKEDRTAPSTPISVPVEAPMSREAPNPGDLVLLSDPQLKLPSHLTTPPLVDVPKRAFKENLLQKGRPAYFIVSILINEQGDVEQVKIHRSPLARNAYDHGIADKVMKVAQKMKFTAPTKQNVPVKVWSYATVHLNTKK